MKGHLIIACLSGAFALVSVPTVSAEPVLDQYGDVSVVWADDEGLSRLHFSDYDETTPESGCSQRATEVVTVLSQQLNTPYGRDDLFRARGSDGHVHDYRIPPNDAPRVITSWFGRLLEEGNALKVATVQCGQGGFVYVSDVQLVR